MLLFQPKCTKQHLNANCSDIIVNLHKNIDLREQEQQRKRGGAYSLKRLLRSSRSNLEIIALGITKEH